jgi:hypothetical protein
VFLRWLFRDPLCRSSASMSDSHSQNVARLRSEKTKRTHYSASSTSAYLFAMAKGWRVRSNDLRRRSPSWGDVSKIYALPIPAMIRSVLKTPRAAYYRTHITRSSNTPTFINGVIIMRVDCCGSRAIPARARPCCSAASWTKWRSRIPG